LHAKQQPTCNKQSHSNHSPLHAHMPQHLKGTCSFVATSTSKECGKPIDPEGLKSGVACCSDKNHSKQLIALGIKHPNLRTLQSGYASKLQVHYNAGWPHENKALKEFHQDVVSGVKAARALDERDEEAERKAALNALERGPVTAAVPANMSADEDESESSKAAKLLKQAASLNEAVCPEACKVLERAAEAWLAGRQLLSNVVLLSGAVVTDPQRQAFEAVKVSVSSCTASASGRQQDAGSRKGHEQP
jgi:hypothetical protein